MKISRIRHVLITSIIFLVVIVLIVAVYSSQLTAIRNSTEEQVFRIRASRDIIPGEVITINNVERVEIPDSLDMENILYRLSADHTHSELVKEYNKNGSFLENAGNDKEKAKYDILDKENVNTWAIGTPDIIGPEKVKVAKQKIYKGQILTNDMLEFKENIAPENTRIYSISLDSSSTGGYNVKIGDTVDICLLYDEDAANDYQNLANNKVIDVVLAQMKIIDIRDESGNSGEGVVPGYVCFNLTYDQINKAELAKKQGTLFVTRPGTYYKEGSQAETFMAGVTLPNF